MTDFCFVNVSFGDRYVRTQERLKESILRIYPDAAMFFWTHELPPKSKPFVQSLYGFKVHAVNHAREAGFKKIIWIDTCAVLKSYVEPLWPLLKTYGVWAVADEVTVKRYCSQKLRDTYKIPDTLKLVGGSLYLFDFENFKSQLIFRQWEKMEAAGLFGSMGLIMNEGKTNDGIDHCGHRMDETCMAICMWLHNSMPIPRDISLYDQVMSKEHFVEPGTNGLSNYIKENQ